MKRYILMFSFLVFGVYCSAASITTPENLPTYYATLQGKSGAGLFLELTAITNKNFKTLGYDGLYTAYTKTDYTPSGELWDMYSDCGTTKKCGSYDEECDCYNREHSIPQSWWGGGTSGIGCDIFHVVPTDGYVNNRRGNSPFGEVSNATYTSKNGSKFGPSVSSIPVTEKIICSSANSSVSTPGGNVFEPIDEYKGDFARNYLGVIMKWNTSRTMNSSEGSKFFQSSYTANSNYGLKPYGVALLLKWHRQDPVSQKEIDRNNGIQATQGNRNPFIDYPYLAEYIWGEHAGEAVDMDNLMCSASSEFIPGQSDGKANGTGQHHEDNLIKIMWLADGGEYTSGNPSTSVLKGTRPSALPDSPQPCSGTQTVFCGWTATPIDGISDVAPEDLFTQPENAPEINAFTIFYAVFAEQIGVSSGSGEPQTLVWSASGQSEGWTASGLMSASDYSVLKKGATITSPSIGLSELKSITINMRTYGGEQYNTITVSANDNVIASLATSKGKTFTDVSWKNSSNLNGNAPLEFTSSTSGVKQGPGINTITVKTKGVSYSYGAYRTSCSATTQLETITNQRPTIPCYKYIRGGQLIINIQGVEYNTQGQQLKVGSIN